MNMVLFMFLSVMVVLVFALGVSVVIKEPFERTVFPQYTTCKDNMQSFCEDRQFEYLANYDGYLEEKRTF